ncbi:MAG: hypothetical protein LBU23_05670, partial [Planctomycetota bacterium]|jgi:hypothetical protein|nr:hypothetical protein [Planctomycetota bacterium]
MRHAREIHRYANAFCLPSPANLALTGRRRENFSGVVRRMIKDMRALLLLARHKGISRFCNLEQIEAYLEGAGAALETTASAEFADRFQLN